MTTSIMKKLRDQGCGTSMRQEDEAAARWPYASIQLSCSLRMRSRGPSSEPKRNERGPRKRDFEHIRSDLEHLVARCGDKFCIRTLYDSTMKQAETSHTLLPGLSRHRVIDALPRYFNEGGEQGFPRALDWDGRSPKDPAWRAFLRVQVPWKGDAGDPNAVDTNDWVIDPVQPSQHKQDHGIDDLHELRNFYAFLFAQRRQATFASNVSDRAYNIWLPPALLAPERISTDRAKDSVFAVLPFLSLLRLPNQSSWRPTLTLTVLFVPVCVPQGLNSWNGVLEARALSSATEAKTITSSLQGSTSYAPRSAEEPYQCTKGGDLLLRYLRLVATGNCPRRRCKCLSWPANKIGHPVTIRQYVEAILLTLTASAPQALPGPRKRGGVSEHQLMASEVARSVRLTSIWSIQLLSRQKILWRENNGRYDAGGFVGKSAGPAKVRKSRAQCHSQIAGLPLEVQLVIKELAKPGHLPAEADRIDDVYTLETEGGMSWKMPRSRSLLSIQSIHDDHFPDTSAHKTFAWIGVMVMAAVAIREMTQALLHETIQAKSSQDLARVDRSMLVELEEIYDVDIVGSVFTRFYRNLRMQLGLDADYARVREQVQSLSAATSRESNIRSNTWSRAIAAAAAAFGAAVLLLSIFGYPQQLPPNRQSEIWWAVAILASAFLVAALFLIFSRGKERLSTSAVWAISAIALVAVVCFIWEAAHFAAGAPVPWAHFPF